MATGNAGGNDPEGSKVSEKLAVLVYISSSFDQVIEATEKMMIEINDRAKRVEQRVCISNAKGMIEILRAKANGKVLEEKVLDLESKSG